MRAQQHEFKRRNDRLLKAHDLEGFFRPNEASSGDIPAQTSSAAELLRKFQIGFIAAQEVERAPVVFDVVSSRIPSHDFSALVPERNPAHPEPSIDTVASAKPMLELKRLAGREAGTPGAFAERKVIGMNRRSPAMAVGIFQRRAGKVAP